MTVPRFDLDSLPAWTGRARQAYHANYLAMYSSWFGGIVVDPVLMLIPADDHMTHRGDAVFEAFKCVAGAIYNLRAHLDRLVVSAAKIGIKAPVTSLTREEIIIATARAGGDPECMIRIYLARGPGSFSANPADCPESQLYVVVTRRPRPWMERFPSGVKIRISSVPVKPAPFAAIKSCNYLPNALMEQEAAAAGVQFAVAFDERGRLAEGATENVGIVTRDRRLLFPRGDRLLAGTTMLRLAELARSLVRDGDLRETGFADISRREFDAAAEILICGTTPDVTAVIEADGQTIGAGRPGPVFRKLSAMLLDDIHHNSALRTPVFDRVETDQASG